VFPTCGMTLSHLWFQESSKASVSCPAHSITLFNSALNDDFRVHDNMNINPNAVAKNLVQFCVCVNVFLFFRSSELAPETFRATMAVLRQRTSSDSKLRGWILLSLFLFLCQDSVRSVETFFKLKQAWPADVLRACSLTMSQHRQNSTWSNI